MRRLTVLVALGAAGAVLLAFLGQPTERARGPLAITNPQAEPSRVDTVGSARRVHTSQPAELLVLDTLPPDGPTALLWFAGRPTQQAKDGALVLDGAGGVIRFDEQLRVRRVLLHLEGREVLGLAPAPSEDVWIVDRDGGVFRADGHGTLTRVGTSPFMFGELGGDGMGGAWIARSPAQFAYAISSEDEPLLARLDVTGAIAPSPNRIRLPDHVLLADLANAGRVVGRGDTVYYAPFIRDEILALTAAGDTLWIAERALPQSIPDPRFELVEGRAVINYYPVNLGAAIGPDDRLYVLSTPGFTTERSRLDVFDRHNGMLLRTAELSTATPTLAVTADGRVHLLDQLELLTGLRPTDREPVTPFDLERLHGGALANHDLEGYVTLINFWASWCAPCREEMPALDTLRHAIQDSVFQFLTINEDMNVKDAQAFIDEYGFSFPVLLGHGTMKTRFHYFGLPFTLLVDRDGNVVQQWIGFAGPDQIARIRAVIDAELARTAGGGPRDPSAHRVAGEHRH